MIRKVSVLTIIVTLLMASIVRAQGFIDELAILPSGAMTFTDGIEMSVDHFGENWTLSRQVLGSVKPYSDVAVVSDKQWSLKGNFVGFDFTQSITSLQQNKIRYQVGVKQDKGVQTSQLAFVITLPTDRFGGQSLICNAKRINLPKKPGNESVFGSGKVNSLIIPTSAGRLVVRGGESLFIQDSRKYGEIYQHFSLRFSFSPGAGLIRQSSIDLTIELQPYRSEPVSIAKQANMGFADEVASDGKGGWTDQGPSNDLRTLTVGKQRFGGVLFDIINPAANNGKSCMVFAGPQQPTFMRSATVPANGKAFPFLYLLHAIAWPPEQFGKIGQIQAKYADGETQIIDINFDRDVSNWWNALTTPNGDVVWTSRSGTGLFLSRFNLKDKPLVSLTFEPTALAVWMVVGASLGESIPKPFISPPTYIVAGDRWAPYKFDLSVLPGSIMDFSIFNHAPAGKIGPIIEKNGHFVYQNDPTRRARLIGSNLCFSANYQPKEACKKMAENMARMGYNAVRFHHYDNSLSNFSGPDVTLNPVELDKLDYLFACCKEKGIYVTIDLHTIRILAKGLIPEADVSSNNEHVMKALVPISEPARKNWETFTRNLLTHVNPYTKMAWKDDPALFGICIMNEANLEFWVDQWPSIRELYQREFTRWLNGKNPISAERSRLYAQFLAETQLRSYERCKAFIRSLGCKALLTDDNFIDSPQTRFVRPHQDFNDNHIYRAALTPIHRWGALPAKSNQDNDLKTFASLPMVMAKARVFGKPYTISEFNMAFPNRYRAESGLMMGAYGGLQDWDGLFRFAYAHAAQNTQNVNATVWMELALDPINLLSERISALLFARQDVKPANQSVPLALTRQEVFDPMINEEDIQQAYRNLGLQYRIGQWDLENSNIIPDSIYKAVGVAKDSPAAVKNVPYQQLSKSRLTAMLKNSDRIESDTGQIVLFPRQGQMSVVTEKTECFALEEKQSLSGNVLTVKNNGPFSVVMLSAMDNRPLTQSQRLVLFHLTDSSNTNARYFDKECTVIEEWGTLPHLVRIGAVTLSMKADPSRKIKLWAVDMSGKRIAELPVKRTKDGFEFVLQTNQPTGGCMTYELEYDERKI